MIEILFSCHFSQKPKTSPSHETPNELFLQISKTSLYDSITTHLCGLLQQKAANAAMLSSNTIRWAMSLSGTVVLFPNEMGLPEILK